MQKSVANECGKAFDICCYMSTGDNDSVLQVK